MSAAEDRQQHTLFLRALTSRLAEVRSLSAAWGPPGAPLTERAYLAALRRLRDGCHEWTAADVLRSLQGAEGAPLALGEGGGCGGGGGGGVVLLRRGFPPWSPACPRCPWLRYACPVLQALLCSCYEDWLEVGLGACSALLAAVAPMVECAAQCSVEDLREPGAAGGGAEGEEGEGEGAAGEAGEGEEGEESEEGEEEGEGGGGAVGGRGGRGRRPAGAELEQRLLRHLAALGALEFARLAAPLVPALASAAQCPNPATQRAAGAACTTLRRALHAVSHLREG
jgi:hypothetical protein